MNIASGSSCEAGISRAPNPPHASSAVHTFAPNPSYTHTKTHTQPPTLIMDFIKKATDSVSGSGSGSKSETKPKASGQQDYVDKGKCPPLLEETSLLTTLKPSTSDPRRPATTSPPELTRRSLMVLAASTRRSLGELQFIMSPRHHADQACSCRSKVNDKYSN